MLPRATLAATPAVFMAVLLTSAAPFVNAQRQTTVPTVQYVVGFVKMPDSAKRGKVYDEDLAREDNALSFTVVTVHNPAAFEARARADPNVRYVSVDDPHAVRMQLTPSDPYYSQQYGLAHLNAPAAWDTTTGSASIVVAVLDTGVDHAHPDLAGARLLQGYNFMANSVDTSDTCGHGTHVAGILGATASNGAGVAGAAQVTILPIKVMDKDPATGACTGPFSAVASGIRYAVDHGARVISMSLGCAGCYDQSTEDAIQYALQHNVLLVAAAGNSGPCSDCVVWPAADAGVMAVACSDQSDAQCSFSSAGAQVEITAPGKNIYSTVPGGGYMSMSGTSMSTPYVAGAAALAFSANPTLTGAQVRNLLDSTARDLGASGVDSVFGHGLADMSALVKAATGAAPPPYVNQAPTASFSWSASGLTLSVNGGGSRDSDGSIASYSWSWGDGSAAGSGVTATHAFAAGGSYSVTLTVKDNASASGSTSQTITVVAPAAPAPTMHVSDITGSVASGKSGTKLSWSVPVLSATNASVSGATVTVTISWSNGSQTMTGTTGSNGLASFTLQQKRVTSGTTYTLCVGSVADSGWAYDAAANYESCQALVV